MTSLKKYNLKGDEQGEIKADAMFTEAAANSQMIKDYIVAIRENARQWSASTRDRSEVNATGKKPHPQKKTGKARQGSLCTPQFKGGGIVHGPKPKFNQHVRINKKERRAAIRFLLGEKMKNGQVIILDDTEMEMPKTKTVASFLQARGIKGKTLLLADSAFDSIEGKEGTKQVNIPSDKHANIAKSVKNIPEMAFSLAKNISGYNVSWAKNLIISEKALSELQDWLKAS
ncbi:50S ribosomal protein L4 [Chlamydiales bacterium SCGC AG-110-M15]|nr:50S ribosomal protein L4 [Chlamydiales bacterium SCGC AG-110-M15]